MKFPRPLVLLISIFLIAQPLWTQGQRPLDRELLKSLLNNPQKITAQVTLQILGKIEYCGILAKFQGVFPLPKAKIISVINDLENYPQIFSSVREVKVDRSASGVFQAQTVVVGIPGLENRSWFRNQILLEELVNPVATKIRWVQVEGDGTVVGAQGYWYLEEFNYQGKTMTYLLYETASSVPKTVFAQENVMGMFLEGQIKDVILAVTRRAEMLK